MTTSTTVHLVAGDSAGGCLRAAVDAGALTGDLVVIHDELSHGPLTPPAARDDYWRSLQRGFGDQAGDAPDSDSVWLPVRELPDGHEIIVWGGANPGDVVLLNTVCAELTSRLGALWHVDVSAAGLGRHYPAEFRPEELAGMFPRTARQVRDRERSDRALERNRLARTTGVLRRFELGEVVGAAPDAYDEWLLDAAAAGQVPVTRAIGTAMARCDPHNRMGDVFFLGRVQALVDAGRLSTAGGAPSLFQELIQPTR